MSYTPNTWVARQGTGLNRYQDQNGDYITLTPAPESVTTPGTPFSVDWMNNIEQGIYTNSEDVSGIQLLLKNASSINYYVSTTGSDDTGDGTSANPFATVTNAVEQIPVYAGQTTIYVASGTYSEDITIHNVHNVTIEAQDTSQPPVFNTISVCGSYCVQVTSLKFVSSIVPDINPQLSDVSTVMAFIQDSTVFFLNCTFAPNVSTATSLFGYRNTVLFSWNPVFTNSKTCVYAYMSAQCYIRAASGTCQNAYSANGAFIWTMYSGITTSGTAIITGNGGEVKS